jgi:hypothetical protein
LRRHDQRGWKDTYRVGRIREIRRVRRRVRIGAPDASLTRFSGAIAVTELVDRLAMIKLLDAAIGPIKSRDRGFSGGQLLVGIAAAQLAGEDFLVGLDRQRADEAGQVLAVVPGLASTTAAGLARKFTDGQWHAVETGLADVAAAALRALGVVAPARAAALCETVTIDLDTTDVEVYGRKKRGVAFNHQGQRVGRPHVATWAETATVLAADLMSGRDDPRPHAPELLRRALAALPAAARGGRIRLRADAGYFAGELARTALFAEVEFAIGARRIAPLWRILDGVAETDWTDAIDMTNAQVAIAEYCPDWWPGRSPPTRGPDVDAPCTPTSERCPSTSWPTPTPSTATRSWSPTWTCPPVSGRPRWSTGTDTGPRSRTCSAMPSTGPPCGTSRPGIRRSTPHGCGVRCSRPASPAGCTSSPRPARASGCSATVSAAAKP